LNIKLSAFNEQYLEYSKKVNTAKSWRSNQTAIQAFMNFIGTGERINKTSFGIVILHEFRWKFRMTVLDMSDTFPSMHSDCLHRWQTSWNIGTACGTPEETGRFLEK
jgi:hypothetical protein